MSLKGICSETVVLFACSLLLISLFVSECCVAYQRKVVTAWFHCIVFLTSPAELLLCGQYQSMCALTG